jgi:FKBP-type peptidyl-prolyl cis-trans isomerase FklB
MLRREIFIAICFCLGFLTSELFGQEGSAGQAGVAPTFQPSTVVPQANDESLAKKASFIIGYNSTARLLSELKQQNVDFDLDKLVEGIQKAVKGEDLGMTNEEVRTVMMAFQKVVEKQQIERLTRLAKENQVEGDAYLAENVKKEGVKTLPSGVQYKVLQAGTGEQPKMESRVRVDYHGTLPDGTVFDSTLKPLDGSEPSPAEFAVARVVPGFSAAIQAMKVGGKWQVAIPGDQAYGMRGKGEIGPNQTLLFEIHLLEILN